MSPSGYDTLMENARLPRPVERGFVPVLDGQVHYRCAGVRRADSTPVYIAHPAPGSSRGQVPLIEVLAQSAFVVAPDMLGSGDSAPPLRETPTIEYYADSALQIMDALHLERVDFYGSHTGAEIGCELAAAHPERIRRIVFDGLAVFPEEQRLELLARYAPRVAPVDAGTHLLWAWNFVRDLWRFFPYYDQRPETALGNPVPAADQLHAAVVDVLKNLDTYQLAYGAAFAYKVEERLPRVQAPALLMASARDPLSAYLDAACRALPTARRLLLPRAATLVDRARAVAEFFNGANDPR